MTTPTAEESMALMSNPRKWTDAFEFMQHLRAALDREATTQAERDAARAEAERLRAALSDFVEMGKQYGWDGATTGRQVLMRAARAALASEPSQ